MTHISMTSNSVSLTHNSLQTLISNCLLHICLRMLHKYLQLLTDTKLNASAAPQTQCAPSLFTPPITQSICHLANLSNAGLLPLHTVHIPPPHSSSPSLLHCPNLGLHQFSAAATCYLISLPHAPPYDLFPAPCSQSPETLLPTEDPTNGLVGALSGAWKEPNLSTHLVTGSQPADPTADPEAKPCPSAGPAGPWSCKRANLPRD